jgi:hypothetical protein
MVLVIVVALGAFADISFQAREDVCRYRTYPIVPLNTPITMPSRTAPEGLSKYRNEDLRFSLFYRSDFQVNELSEAGGAKTIVFQNPDTFEGFQIFVVPYTTSGIVPRRIAKDVPSGNAIGQATTSVDGICARAFTTRSPIMPPTSEVWVARRGNLFEITVYEEYQAILDQVINSWRFL